MIKRVGMLWLVIGVVTLLLGVSGLGLGIAYGEDILISDDFEDGSLTNTPESPTNPIWRGDLRGEIVEESGGNHVWKRKVPGAGGALVGKEDWTDYQVEVDVRLSGSFGPDIAGVAVRATEAGFYSISLMYGGEAFQVVKYIKRDNSFQTLASVNFEDCRDGKVRRLKVVCKGTRIQAYVDDKLLLDVIDTGQLGVGPYQAGAVGIRTNGGDVAFDNFKVIDLRPPSVTLTAESTGRGGASEPPSQKAGGRSLTGTVLMEKISKGGLASMLEDLTPICIWASDPIRPGEAGILRGDGFGKTDRIELVRLEDVDAGEPAYVIGKRPEGVSLDREAQARATVLEWPKEGISTLEPIQASTNSVKFIVPEDIKPGVFAVRAVTSGGVSQAILLNRPDVWWCQGDQGRTASPGGWMRLFGKNLAMDGKETVVVFEPVDGAGKLVRLGAECADPYSAKVNLPSDITVGEYLVYLHNGYGGKVSWSMPLRIKVEEVKPWPDTVYNVRDFGAKGNGEDDTEAIRAALAKAGEAGGGIVYFPRGRYMVTRALEIPRFITLRGEARELVNVFWPDFPEGENPPEALIRGTNHFAIEDLTFYATRYRNFIVADQTGPEAGNVFIRRIRIRANAFRGHLQFEEVDKRFREIAMSRGGAQKSDLLKLGGENVQVVESDLYGSGRSLHLLGIHNGLIARNIFYNGRRGWYCITGSDGLIFEDNQILGADLMSSGGGINNLGSKSSQNVYFARNTFRNLYGWDREAMTTDGGGGAYFGPIQSADELSVILPEGGKDANWQPDQWVGAGVFIISGKGAGQYRQIVQHSKDKIELDRPWDIIPDLTSVISVTMIQRNLLFVQNEFVDAGIGLQYYGTSINIIASGNSSTRSGGFHNIGKKYTTGYQPSWYIQWFDNEILEGACYRFGANNATLSDASHMATFAWPADTDEPMAICAIYRRNHLHNNAHFLISGQRATPVIEDVIIEGNAVENSDRGVVLEGGITRVFLRGNSFKNVLEEIQIPSDATLKDLDIEVVK